MEYCVCILTNQYRVSLYIGVTRDLAKRMYEHKNGIYEGFTKKYDVHRLVYYETYKYVFDALDRENKLKHWKREWKVALIETVNPEWEELRYISIP